MDLKHSYKLGIDKNNFTAKELENTTENIQEIK